MFKGRERQPVDEAVAGDIVLVNGFDELNIGTRSDQPDAPRRCRCCGSTSDAVDEFLRQHQPLAGRKAGCDEPPVARETGAGAQIERRDANARNRRQTVFEVAGRGKLHLRS